jgi:hypothetical protein
MVDEKSFVKHTGRSGENREIWNWKYMEISDGKQRDLGKMLTLFKNFCFLFLTIDKCKGKNFDLEQLRQQVLGSLRNHLSIEIKSSRQKN